MILLASTSKLHVGISLDFDYVDGNSKLLKYDLCLLYIQGLRVSMSVSYNGLAHKRNGR